MTDVSWISIFFIWSNRQTRDSNSSSFKANWKKNSNKLVCFWDFFYRGNYSPHVFLENKSELEEAFCVYLLFLLSIKKISHWWNKILIQFLWKKNLASILVNTIIIWNSARNIKRRLFPVPIAHANCQKIKNKHR